MKTNEKNLLYSISTIRRRAFAFLQAELKKVGIEDLPPSYGDILFAIDRKDGLSIKEICEISNKDKSTVSLIVNNLEKNGYVLKERDENDGRSLKIRLSKKAQREGKKMMEISRKLQEQIYQGLNEEDKATLFKLLERIGANL